MTAIETHWVVGPGAIGRLIALRLAGGGNRVALVGRRTLPAQQWLFPPEGAPLQRTVACTTLDTPPPFAPDIVHLTTKAYAAEAAYDAVSTALPPNTPLMLWQNGFDVQPRLTERHPGPVLCATTTEGAYVEGDDRVVHAGHGETLVGALDGGHAALARTLAGVLRRSGLPCRAVDDIRTRLWHKLAVNAAINPLVARHRIRNGELRDDAFHPAVEAIIAELATILAAEGIAPPTGEGLDGWRALVWRVVEATAGNRASMLQDVLAGRPTEHAAILGPLLAAANRHGLAAPRLAELHAWLADHAAPC
ncbi:ketopantoate reductase family protein [Halomonas ramblicola]|uniref:ketopantoate reductase family protein n=1 Tax=Halomonas ramblicola TaxID=747349 RepID=UPI0025B513B3|nr:2-dehydropantoate 2-reductase [Halomonas ramblicola]MDN3522171.1 2-dehydropantoate 2-reductase [Halomonas ramblicola]